MPMDDAIKKPPIFWVLYGISVSQIREITGLASGNKNFLFLNTEQLPHEHP